MAKYRVFAANWWDDAECTQPITAPRTTRTVAIVNSEEEAMARCRKYNRDDSGKFIHRPYGLAYEYERA